MSLATRISLFDTGCFAAKVAKIIKLSTANLTATNNVDVIDDRCVQREDTFDAYAEADLSHGYRLADAAMFASNANALERLQAFLCAFFDPDVNAKRIARLKCGNVLFKLSLFDYIQSIHFIVRPEVNR